MNKKELEKFLVAADTTIKEAMQKLSERTARKILFVTDGEVKLLGTVTDGDIRRKLLEGFKYENKIKDVMRTEFRYVESNMKNKMECARRLMVEIGIEQIPILNEDGVIVDVVLWTDFLKEKGKSVRTVAIIPARGGSKGIPHKNLKLLSGKPLISYVVEACLNTPEIDTVAVSTDSDEIKNAVKAYEEVIIIDRPKELATDNSTSEEAILHAIEILENEKLIFDMILFAQATSPLTEPDDFSKLIRKVKEEGCDSSVFYVEDYGFFFGLDDVLVPRLPRQVRTPKKRESGNGWVFTKEGFLRHKCRLFGDVGLCKIEYPKNLEIDSYHDLYMVERLLQLSERRKRQLYYKTRSIETEQNDVFEENYWCTIVDPDGNTRNRLEERNQRINDMQEELQYVNNLPCGRILDIGCGTGDFLSAVNKNWDKYGLEISKYAANKAKECSNIFVGDLEEAPYKDEYFDVIVMYHVIEHLKKPEEGIIKVRTMLKQNGILIIGTPDFDGAMAERFAENYRLLCDETHVSLFSRISLRYFLEDFGFEIEKESFPFFKTRHFTEENLMRLFDVGKVSPPFWGSFMTFYCRKK